MGKVEEFLRRLKERKLVQWTLAYCAGAFALLQGVDIVSQRFGWPEQIERFLIVALGIGFFVALVLAWYHGDRGTQRMSGAELSILALLLAIGGGILWRVASTARMPEVVPTTASASLGAASTAVLPFVNMSADKANEYFSDGMTETLLNRLAQVPQLKVAARTSSFSFKGTNTDVRRIGAQLGVASLVEGSVQQAGDTLRITAQLVRASHRHDRRIFERYAQHGQVGIRIHADDLRRGDAAVGQLYADLVRTLDDVVIGDDVACFVDDDAGAEAALDALADRGRMLP